MTLNGVSPNGPYSLRYFNDFGKPVFQLITVFSSIKLIDQNSAS